MKRGTFLAIYMGILWNKRRSPLKESSNFNPHKARVSGKFDSTKDLQS